MTTRAGPAESEKSFQARIVAWARYNGWLPYHVLDSRGSAPGFPDLVLACLWAGDLVIYECKAGRGRVSDAQLRWIDRLQAAGVDASIVRPSDWAKIEERLRRPR